MAIVVYDAVATRFGDRDEAGLAVPVAKAMGGRTGAALKSGDMNRARELAESIIGGFEDCPADGIQRVVELARTVLQLRES